MPQAVDEAGNIWETDAQGNPIRFVGRQGAASSGGYTVGTPSATKVQKSAADLTAANLGNSRTVVQTQGDALGNQKTGAELPFVAPKAAADATKAGAEAASAARLNGLPAETYNKANAQWSAALQLDRLIADMRTKFAQGPGSTRGVAGLKDYLPSEANQRFDKAGSGARGIVRNALGLTGGENNTAAEAGLNLGAYIPEASNFDGTNMDILANLEALRNSAREQAIRSFGGIPDANGNITPVHPQNAMTAPRVMEGAGPGAAGYGAEITRDNIPRAMQDEYNAFISQNIGRLTPDDYARFRTELDQRYGYPTEPTQLEIYRQEGERIGQVGRKGGTIDARIPGPVRPMSMIEQGRNNLVNNPLGAAAVGALNMGGFGGVEALAGDQYDALRETQGLPLILGEIGGAIGGTKILGDIAGAGASRLAPGLLGGGGGGQFARGLATDVAYSGGYGGVTGQDPVTSALAGGVGSVAGQGVGKLGGAVLGGVRASPVAQALRESGIATTVGQTLGGIPKAIEDGMTSIPGVGDIIQARRLEGLRDFNKLALARAGEPVQAVTSNLGEQGAGDLLDQISGAYDNATAGVTVPLDPQFTADMALARQAGSQLPADLASRFDLAVANRVEPIATAGQMTGDTYQQVTRGLKGYKAEATKPGFEEDYRGALSSVQDALRGNMERGGGASVIEGLASADKAYRQTKTVEAAIKAARNGSRSGEVQTFAPSQLTDADYASAKKYGGQRSFADLSDAAQQVLPSKIPDSGTGRRAVQAAILAGLTGSAGAGIGYAGGDTTEGALKGAVAGALLAAGGTKTGQSLIIEALTGRPKAMQDLGNFVRRQQGRISSGSVPIALDSTR